MSAITLEHCPPSAWNRVRHRVEYAVERESMDRATLQRLIEQRAYTEPSTSELTERMWFSTADPEQNRENFDGDRSKTFALHLIAVDGHDPGLQDYADLARMLAADVQGLDDFPEGGAQPNVLYGYYVDLDERGEFLGDVRSVGGETVFVVRGGESLSVDESSLVDDGFMSNFRDVDGLTTYLRDVGVIPLNAKILDAQQFEDELEREQRSWEEYKAEQDEIYEARLVASYEARGLGNIY